jgi:hemoglobin/transferrin/lactoferrin receptor protein
MKYIILLSALAWISAGTAQRNTTQSIKEVVISGAKRETERQEISQTIDIITKKELQFNSAGNTGDALQNTGTITVQQSQNGGGSPIMRGFEANRIGIVVDGVRMNTAIFRGGHLQNVLRIDNGQLDRIEVFNGAGSTLYGSDALGGVLNFVTASPELGTNWKGNAFIRYTTASNEKTAGFTVNYGKSKWASLTSFTYSDFGNLISGNMRDPQYGNWGKRMYTSERINGRDTMIANTNPNEQTPTGYIQYNMLQKLLWKPNEKVSHNFNFQYSNSSDVQRYDRLTERRNNAIDPDPRINQFNLAEWYYGPEARLMIAYQLDVKKKTKYYDSYRLTVAYQNYKESRMSRNFQNNNLRAQRENVDVAGINLDVFKTIKNHQLTYGIEVVRNWVGSSVVRYNIVTGDNSYASTRYPDGGSTTTNLSVFAQDVITLTKNVAYLNLGVRGSHNAIDATITDTLRKYNSFSVSNFAHSVNAGLSFLPTSKNKISLNFSTGYRTPNLDDVTKVFDNTTWIQVNDPNVKPELAMNYEINVWNKFGDNSTLEFGGYYTKVEDYIINEPTQFNGASFETINGVRYNYQRLGNSSSARIMGLYSNILLRIDHNWQATGVFNYTYGRVTSSSNSLEVPLDHIAPWSGRIAIQYKNEKLQTEISILMNGQKSAEDYSLSGEDNIDKSADPINGLSPAWQILNMRTSYQISKRIAVQAALENLFDTHYRVFASGLSSAGRNLRLTLRTFF